MFCSSVVWWSTSNNAAINLGFFSVTADLLRWAKTTAANEHHFFFLVLLARLLGCIAPAEVGVVFGWTSSSAAFSCSFFMDAIWQLLNALKASNNFSHSAYEIRQRERSGGVMSKQWKRQLTNSLWWSKQLIMVLFYRQLQTKRVSVSLTCMFSYISSWCHINPCCADICFSWCSSTFWRANR